MVQRSGSSASLPDITTDTSQKEETIRVCTRLRPLFPKEVNTGHLKAWKIAEQHMQLVMDPPTQAEVLRAKKDDKSKRVNTDRSEGQKSVIQRYFAYDRCFDQNCTNDEVYDYVARDIVLDTFKGINGCCLAYGQTGSGKTHSIMGISADPGILPRALAEFFDVIADPSILDEEYNENKSDIGSVQESENSEGNTEYLMKISYIEIYMERVNDLLQDGPKGPTSPAENLEVKEDPKKGFIVVGLQEEIVSSMDQVMEILQKAEQKRHFARTNFNETSSRSHTVFTVILESNRVLADGTSIQRKGELKLVDLAGNERVGKATEGVENSKSVMEEGKAINKSLFLLSEVISKLSKKAQMNAEEKKKQDDAVFIPWRDSKLTRILSKSLGGNCRASVIVAVHPSHMYLDTSFSTLRFASKCKTIKKTIHVNFLSPEQSLIVQQKELISKLQNQLKAMAEGQGGAVGLEEVITKSTKKSKAISEEELKKVEDMKEELKKKMNKYQKLILKSTNLAPVEFSGGGKQTVSSFLRNRAATKSFGRMSTISAIHFESPLDLIEDEREVPEKDVSDKGFKAMNIINKLNDLDISNQEELLKLESLRKLESVEGYSKQISLESIAGDLEMLEKLQIARQGSGSNVLERMSSGAAKLFAPEGEEGGQTGESISLFQGPEGHKLIKYQDIAMTLIGKLKKKLAEEKDSRKSVIKENINLINQAKYLKNMVQKLGLSILPTAAQPSTKYDIKNLKINEKFYSTEEGFTESIFDDPTDIKPFASSVLNYCITYALLRHFNAKEEAKLSNNGVNENLAPATKLKLKEISAPLSFPKSLESIIEADETLRLLAPKLNKEDETKFKKIEELKDENIESVLEFLSPWEVHVLAILYEQQELRKSLNQIKKHFAQTCKKIDLGIKQAMVEKHELSEHVERLQNNLNEYMKTSQLFGDTGGKFQKLMSTLEKVSLGLANKNSEYKILATEYSNLKSQNLQQEAIISKLREENRALFLLPNSIPFLDKILKKCDSERERLLVQDVFLFQAKYSELKLRIDEARALAEDTRQINVSLFNELNNTKEELSSSKNALQLAQFSLNKERKIAKEREKSLEQEKSDLMKKLNNLMDSNKSTPSLKQADSTEQEKPNTNEKLERAQSSTKLKAKGKAKSKTKDKLVKVNTGTKATIPERPSELSKPLTLKARNLSFLKDLDTSKIKATAPDRINRVISYEQERQPSIEEKAESLKTSEVPELEHLEAPEPIVVGLPAFQGNPRDKGFTNMAAAITRRPRAKK